MAAARESERASGRERERRFLRREEADVGDGRARAAISSADSLTFYFFEQR
jgi:hypothetical protein